MKQTTILQNPKIQVTNCNFKNNNEIEIVFNSEITLVLNYDSAVDLFDRLEYELFDESEWRENIERTIIDLETEIEDLECQLSNANDDDDNDYFGRRDFL